jgi:hypothetical protein
LYFDYCVYYQNAGDSGGNVHRSDDSGAAEDEVEGDEDTRGTVTKGSDEDEDEEEDEDEDEDVDEEKDVDMGGNDAVEEEDNVDNNAATILSSIFCQYKR